MSHENGRHLATGAAGAYSIGCFIVWAVLITVGVMTGHSGDPNHSVLLVILGWFIGWLSATIARSVYPHSGARQQ